MNELTVYYTGACLYFKTDETTIDGAYEQFRAACDLAGICLDNAPPTELALRDENGDDVETMLPDNGVYVDI